MVGFGVISIFLHFKCTHDGHCLCEGQGGGGGVHNWHSTRKHGAINLGSHLTFQDKCHKMIVTLGF